MLKVRLFSSGICDSCWRPNVIIFWEVTFRGSNADRVLNKNLRYHFLVLHLHRTDGRIQLTSANIVLVMPYMCHWRCGDVYTSSLYVGGSNHNGIGRILGTVLLAESTHVRRNSHNITSIEHDTTWKILGKRIRFLKLLDGGRVTWLECRTRK